MTEFELVITVFLFAVTGVLFVVIGELCISLIDNKPYTKIKRGGSGQNPLPSKEQVERQQKRSGRNERD